jgi:hypothetical protein
MQQRNEMMDSFAQILRRLPTSDTSSSNGGTAPFKVQINFDIPIFEGHIDKDVVDKWLNLLEGYFSVHNFSNKRKDYVCTPQSRSPCQRLVGDFL